MHGDVICQRKCQILSLPSEKQSDKLRHFDQSFDTARTFIRRKAHMSHEVEIEIRAVDGCGIRWFAAQCGRCTAYRRETPLEAICAILQFMQASEA